MGIIMDTKESRSVQNFLQKSKEEFASRIARNKVNNIDVSGCVQDEACKEAVRYLVTGSVETTSPTGKIKTYMYRASVDVTGKNCRMADLQVLPPEEE